MSVVDRRERHPHRDYAHRAGAPEVITCAAPEVRKSIVEGEQFEDADVGGCGLRVSSGRVSVGDFFNIDNYQELVRRGHSPRENRKNRLALHQSLNRTQLPDQFLHLLRDESTI